MRKTHQGFTRPIEENDAMTLFTSSSTRQRAFASFVATFVFAAFATSASAGLYPPAAPPGSAFVRVFNGTMQPKIPAQIGDKNVGDTAAMEASSYVFLPPGSYPAKIGGASQSITLQGSKCYTAALENGGAVHLFEQDCFNSQLKVNLAVYNGATKLADAKPVTLERGKTFSLFVTGSASQPVLIWSVN
jgi:alginate O-acetyltransferase complex protein AlgF